MALLYSKFQIISSPQLLPTLPQLTEICEMLTISNFLCSSDLEHRFSRPKPKFCGHHVN